MRLWSIHPEYLDPKGLVALWREGLLAQKVLLGETVGYRHHPQLHRFGRVADPVAAIGAYLREVAGEALRRGYRFDDTKIAREKMTCKLPVTTGQIEYEWWHLQAKLKARCLLMYESNLSVGFPEVHPIFKIIQGGIEDWERLSGIFI